MSRSNGPDIDVLNEGSIFLLMPLTAAGSDWLDEHIGANAQRFGNSVVVEHRYVLDLIDGMQADGLEVSR